MAIEKWYTVLSESERTTAMYSLLQHTNAVQVRFFAQVLSQMQTKLDTSPKSSPSPTSGAGAIIQPPPRVQVTHSSSENTTGTPSSNGLLPHSPNAGVYDPFGAPNSPLLRPQTPGETAIQSANWSMNPPPISISSTPSRSRSPSYSSATAADIVRAGEEKWQTFGLKAAAAGRAPAMAASDAGSDYGGSDTHSAAGTPGSGKGKVPDAVDFALLEGMCAFIPFLIPIPDIPAWLRSLRLHKYTPIFERYHWKDIIRFSDTGMSRCCCH